MRKKNKTNYLHVSETAGRLPANNTLPRKMSSLSDIELLEIVMGDERRNGDIRLMADRLLDGGNAALLRRLTPRKMSQVTGDGRALRVMASLELGHRAIKGSSSGVLSSPKHVQEYARCYATAEREHFLAIHLTTRHIPALLEVVSIGTLNASLVHPREVFRRAIQEGSANLILVHNHPSGDPSPSADDIEITTRLIKVGELVGIDVLDHVILAAERYFSFREEGFLEK